MTADSYPMPAADARYEIAISNSRFIALAGPTASVEAAKAFIAAVRAALPGASHHCYAFLVGHGASVVAGMSDDGEPSGTAGRPMLAVLRGSGLGDVTVVVTRYFGGTLLGTGGLVRAYGDATKAVLDILPRMLKVELADLRIGVAYADYAVVRRTIEAFAAEVRDEQFADTVTLLISLPRSQLDACISLLADITAGRADVA
ncbi:YigZ family protein [Candidatus Gracilibacteria bacterium]|nr:YigZ family protein [Candidatus Gracilibacteria bacterium]